MVKFLDMAKDPKEVSFRFPVRHHQRSTIGEPPNPSLFSTVEKSKTSIDITTPMSNHNILHLIKTQMNPLFFVTVLM